MTAIGARLLVPVNRSVSGHGVRGAAVESAHVRHSSPRPGPRHVLWGRAGMGTAVHGLGRTGTMWVWGADSVT